MDDLTKWAQKAFAEARDFEPRERAMFVASTVGRQAKRLGLDEHDVLRWLQTAYGDVWVRLGQLNPGADLREIRAEIQKAMRRVQPNARASALRGRPSMDTRFGRDLEDPDAVSGAAGSDLDRAMNRYETFHAKKVVRLVELEHDLPTKLVHVGEALAVMYRTDKWHSDGDDEDYKHLHDDGDDKPYQIGRGVKLYEPAEEWRRTVVDGRPRSGKPKSVRGFPVARPKALTLLGYCLGFFARLDPEHDAALGAAEHEEAMRLLNAARRGDREATEALGDMGIYETNPRGSYLFSSPSGDMLAVYSPEEQPDGSTGFLAIMAGGKLRVLKDGIDG